MMGNLSNVPYNISNEIDEETLEDIENKEIIKEAYAFDWEKNIDWELTIRKALQVQREELKSEVKKK